MSDLLHAVGRMGEAAARVTLFIRLSAICYKEKVNLKYSSTTSQYLKGPRIFILTLRHCHKVQN